MGPIVVGGRGRAESGHRRSLIVVQGWGDLDETYTMRLCVLDSDG